MTQNNKEQKPITLEDLAILIKEEVSGIKAEVARVESSLNNAIDELAAMSKNEFDLMRKEMDSIKEEVGQRGAKMDNGFVELGRGVNEVIMDNQSIKRQLSDMQAAMGGYISVYRFDRFKKYNGLKEELDASIEARK